MKEEGDDHRRGKRESDRDQSFGCVVKKKKKLAKGPERRVDSSDQPDGRDQKVDEVVDV